MTQQAPCSLVACFSFIRVVECLFRMDGRTDTIANIMITYSAGLRWVKDFKSLIPTVTEAKVFASILACRRNAKPSVAEAKPC